MRPEDGGIQSERFKRPTFVCALITFGTLPVEFLHAFTRMAMPLNSTSTLLSYKGMEIGVARCKAVQDILSMQYPPEYILWLSDDDLPPWNGLVELWMELERNPSWDVLTSLVYLKSEPPQPVLWHRPTKPHGPLLPDLDFKSGEVVEADVANLGFGLTRTELFRKLEPPYFKTGFMVNTLPDGRDAVIAHTEDCWFFDKVKKVGGRIGVHTGVRSAHLGKDGVIY